jgi:acyl CoA:acetate/3-ketoacid CoA transferase beta subunit
VCGPAGQPTDLGEVDPGADGVIQGRVLRGGEPAAGAFVRLLDEGGEFTAEVVASATGVFRFFARPGTWTVRVLAPGVTGERTLKATAGEVATADVDLG